MIEELLAQQKEGNPIALLLEPDGVWAGKPAVRCKLCPFRTVSGMKQAQLHVLRSHQAALPEPEPEKRMVQSKLVSPSGEPLYLEV